jgi:hypothetical protein
MKSKLVLSFSICLLLLQEANAQLNNIPGHRNDSLDINSFGILVNYISSDTQTLNIAEIEKNTVSHLGEQHQLVTPIQYMPGAGEMAGYGWDNWLPSVYNKEATQGSPFFLPIYVPGLVINQSYHVISNKDYLFNYDKMSGNLLLKRGKESPIAIDREQVNAFCLKVDQGGYIFMRVPLINTNEYFQVIYKGSKYSSYKLYKNKFVNANQKTNGYTSEGKNYDEYEDIETYYIVDEKKQEWNLFELSKKSIKKTMASESVAVDLYFKDHRYEDITESFVSHLLASLNR